MSQCVISSGQLLTEVGGVAAWSGLTNQDSAFTGGRAKVFSIRIISPKLFSEILFCQITEELYEFSRRDTEFGEMF